MAAAHLLVYYVVVIHSVLIFVINSVVIVVVIVNGRSQKIVPKNNIILKVPLDRQDHNGPSRFFPIVACRGGPGRRAGAPAARNN